MEETEARIARNSGGQPAGTPLPEIARVIEKVRLHLSGDLQDFRDVAVDIEKVAPFARRVYGVAREIPAGETRTYGEIAEALNRPGAARAVGHVLGRNPVPLIIPCHRVLASDGKLGGFSAYGGQATKARLLTVEGAAFGRWRGQRSLIL